MISSVVREIHPVILISGCPLADESDVTSSSFHFWTSCGTPAESVASKGQTKPKSQDLGCRVLKHRNEDLQPRSEENRSDNFLLAVMDFAWKYPGISLWQVHGRMKIVPWVALSPFPINISVIFNKSLRLIKLYPDV